jgi:glyoxylate carboligase
MSQTVGDFLVQRLQRWDVCHVFGYPGDGINGVFGALNRAHDKIRFIQARHEEMAAFIGVRVCQILRASWCLYRDVRPRRVAPDHGPL